MHGGHFFPNQSLASSAGTDAVIQLGEWGVSNANPPHGIDLTVGGLHNISNSTTALADDILGTMDFDGLPFLPFMNFKFNIENISSPPSHLARILTGSDMSTAGLGSILGNFNNGKNIFGFGKK